MVTNVLEGARNRVPQTQAAIEGELVYPLIRGADVGRWEGRPSLSILLTHKPGERLRAIPEAEMESTYPKVHSYLKRFEGSLKRRPAFKRYFKEDSPFYSIFNIGDYTFAEWKVVWREQARGLTAAVIGPFEEKVTVPDHKLMMVETGSKQEADYLAAVLNSSPSRLAVAAYAVEIAIDTHVLSNIAIPRFDARNDCHRRLARLGQQAHERKSAGDAGAVQRIEEEIDRETAALWNLAEAELVEMKRSLEDQE